MTLNESYEQVGVNAIKPHPRNTRQGDIGAIHESITENGFFGACVVQRSTGHILAGNHRYLAAKEAGMATVPVLWVDVDDDRALRILLADNRTNDLASYNEAALAQVLAELANTTELGLLGTGFDGDALDELIGDLAGKPTQEAPEAQIDKAAELQEKWGTARGQIWQVGRHRVMCGDSTSAEDVARLMNGAKADCLLTDPPYGMNLDTDYASMPKTTRSFTPVVGDGKPFNAAPIRKMFAATEEQFWFGADYYAGSLGNTEHSGAWLVWDKRVEENYDAGFGSAFELCWSAKKRKREILREMWFQNHAVDHEEAGNRDHPTQKPTRLMSRIMEMSTGAAGKVVDLFIGSGTTVCAAEQTGRTCYGMEIEPKYVAVTIQRLADMGLEPKLIDDGKQS